MELIKGQRLNDRFKVVASLAAGGPGHMLLAQDNLRGDQEVLLEVLSPEQTQVIDSADVLTHRLESVRSLNHANIVLPLEFVNKAEFQVLVMEPFNSEDIESAISHQNLGQEEILELLNQVLAGLEALHLRSLAHGSLTPSSILVNQEKMLKITPLGPLTATGGPAEDIFSFGTICSQLLAKCNNIPKCFKHLISKATHPQPSMRHRDIKELRSTFRSALKKFQTSEERRTNFYILLISLYMFSLLGFLYIFSKLVRNF